MFHVGQLCICVDDSSWAPWLTEDTVPVKGRVYTVRETTIAPIGLRAGGQCIHLVEIVNAICHRLGGYGEPWFWHGDFRPVDDTKIEVFRKALTDAPVDMEPVE